MAAQSHSKSRTHKNYWRVPEGLKGATPSLEVRFAEEANLAESQRIQLTPSRVLLPP
jgi:hypothetical protein